LRTTSRAPAAQCLLALLALSCPASADGIHLSYRTLSSVVGPSGVALQVNVRARDPKARSFRAAVERLWRRGAGRALVAGKVYTFTPPSDPVFTPGRWVAYRVYWDTVPTQGIKPGQRLVLVSSTADPEAQLEAVIPASDRIRAKLDILFQPDWERAYQRRTPIRALVRDLADFDLYELAYATLKTRRTLRESAVLAAAAQAPRHDLLRHHLQSLDVAGRARFLEAAAQHLGRQRGGHRGRLLRLLHEHFTGEALRREELPALSALLHVLQPAREEEANAMPSLYYALMTYLKTAKGRRDAGRFAGHFLRYVPQKPEQSELAHYLREWVELLSPHSRDTFSLAVMKKLLPPRKGKLDALGLQLVLKQPGRLPPGRLVSFLYRVHPYVDPGGDDGCEQVAALARVIVQLATRPGMARRLRRLARAVLPQYTCNVDSDHKERLAAIAAGAR